MRIASFAVLLSSLLPQVGSAELCKGCTDDSESRPCRHNQSDISNVLDLLTRAMGDIRDGGCETITTKVSPYVVDALHGIAELLSKTCPSVNFAKSRLAEISQQIRTSREKGSTFKEERRLTRFYTEIIHFIHYSFIELPSTSVFWSVEATSGTLLAPKRKLEDYIVHAMRNCTMTMVRDEGCLAEQGCRDLTVRSCGQLHLPAHLYIC
ncbi:hypothetical protein RB195_011268 [Necator americanus]|uniref:Secreted protein n=1 Tax=Necator americanus TaxID=51031 RepID=A0ABR1D1U2_NECAM